MSFTSPLDRPVWNSLETHHAALGSGNALARRYDADVSPFASAADETPEAAAALAALMQPGEEAFILQAPLITLVPGLQIVKQAMGVQMVFDAAPPPPDDTAPILPLGDADIPEMMALTELTQPGPFRRRTNRMGAFFGIRIDNRLAAMCGQRMHLPGHTEVSGVCTHPDFRGQGLARVLSNHVIRLILARGETPFLHAWKTNAAAITLYESLGFHHRCDVHVAIIAR